MSDGERSVKMSGIYRLRGMEDVENLPRELELDEYSRLFDRTFFRTGVKVSSIERSRSVESHSPPGRWWPW